MGCQKARSARSCALTVAPSNPVGSSPMLKSCAKTWRSFTALTSARSSRFVTAGGVPAGT